MNHIINYLLIILFSLQMAIVCQSSFSQSSVKQAYLDSLQAKLANISENDTAIVPLLKSLNL